MRHITTLVTCLTVGLWAIIAYLVVPDVIQVAGGMLVEATERWRALLT